mmetsp:Transcript_11790/g.18097  ORF Transcript_11790/g.18097 Transcript_11790/m.18097 type:complete len:102 (+) Transcript_11790:529-834(+)
MKEFLQPFCQRMANEVEERIFKVNDYKTDDIYKRRIENLMNNLRYLVKKDSDDKPLFTLFVRQLFVLQKINPLRLTLQHTKFKEFVDERTQQIVENLKRAE